MKRKKNPLTTKEFDELQSMSQYRNTIASQGRRAAAPDIVKFYQGLSDEQQRVFTHFMDAAREASRHKGAGEAYLDAAWEFGPYDPSKPGLTPYGKNPPMLILGNPPENPDPSLLARFGKEALSGAAFGLGAGITERVIFGRNKKKGEIGVAENPVPSKMSASQINKALDRLDRESLKITEKLIAAGRGMERPSEYLGMSDPLSKRAKDNYEKRSALRQEIAMRYGPGAPTRLPRGRFFGRRNPGMMENPWPPTEITFKTTKKGRKRAYYWSMSQMRWFPMPLEEAELFISTGQSQFLPLHKTMLPPGRYRTMPSNPDEILGVEDGRGTNPLTEEEARSLLWDEDRFLAQARFAPEGNERGYLQGRASGIRHAVREFGPEDAISQWDKWVRHLRRQRSGNPKAKAYGGSREKVRVAHKAQDPFKTGGGMWPAKNPVRVGSRPQDPFSVGPGMWPNPSAEARRYVSKKIRKLRDEGFSQEQAVAIALSMGRKKGFRSIPKGPKRKRNPGGLPTLPDTIASDPEFQKELRAFRRRHGKRGTVEVMRVEVPDGFPKYMSSWGLSPAVYYDAPKRSSNKGKRVHYFGEGKRGKGKLPHLASSASRGPKFLTYVGGNFRANGNWIYF